MDIWALFSWLKASMMQRTSGLHRAVFQENINLCNYRSEKLKFREISEYCTNEEACVFADKYDRFVEENGKRGYMHKFQVTSQSE
jgi:hypothetical protein